VRVLKRFQQWHALHTCHRHCTTTAMSDDLCMRSLAALWSYAVQRMKLCPLSSGLNRRFC
jgi:hypothetical protein